MNYFKAVSYLSLKRIAGTLLLICSCLVIVACSQNEPVEEVETPKATNSSPNNEEAIKAVIEKEFNGPDKKYRELWESAMDAIDTQKDDMTQEEYDASLETPKYQEYMNYMKDSYAPYFTENGYDTFSRTSAFMYSFSDNEYTLNTSDLNIIQSENEETLYNFTFNVNYENKNGETSVYAFDGNAIVPEEGKIGKIQFNDKDGLGQVIQK